MTPSAVPPPATRPIGAAAGALIGSFVSNYVSTAIDGGILDKVTEPSFESAPKEEGVICGEPLLQYGVPLKINLISRQSFGVKLSPKKSGKELQQIDFTTKVMNITFP